MSFTSLQEKYLDSLKKYSDTQEHLYVLREYASKVNYITEFGVRTGVSTCALLSSHPKKMISYDILKQPEVDELISLSKKENVDFNYILNDVLLVDIDPTDLLFIDTIHNYEQTKEELRLHANKVSKYIIFHDTVRYGIKGHEEGKVGIMLAIEEFIKSNNDWKIVDFRDNYNGLLILEKITNYNNFIPVFDTIINSLDKLDCKYMLIVNDRLCEQIKMKCSPGDSLVAVFVHNVLIYIAKWVKNMIPVFGLRMTVVRKQDNVIIIDSDTI